MVLPLVTSSDQHLYQFQLLSAFSDPPFILTCLQLEKLY